MNRSSDPTPGPAGARGEPTGAPAGGPTGETVAEPRTATAREPSATGAPLEGLAFAVAGPGRVGSSLSRWLVAGGARLAAVGFHRRRREAERLAAELAAEAAGRTGGGRRGRGAPRAVPPRVVPLSHLESGGEDLLLVAVADPALDDVVTDLATRPQAAVALHVAGSRGAGALAPLAAAGSAIGTLHPLKAFPRPLPDPAAGRGVTFGVAGDPVALELAERIAAAWGAHPVRVPEEARDLYHLAATLAAGGVVTLLAAAERIAAAAGVPPEVLGGYLELARGAVEEAGEAHAGGGSVAAAITGPAARGDRETVDRHLRTLARVRPELPPLVALVAREALAAMAGSGELSADQRRLLRALEATTKLPGNEMGQGLC